MNKTIKTVLFIAVFSIFVAGGVRFFFWESSNQLPVIELAMLDGERLSTGDLKGNITLINFWATTCSPCRKEIPELISIDREYSGKGVRIIGVSMAYDRPDQVIEFKQLYKIPYSLALDIDSAVAHAFKVKTIPLTLLISPHGKIEYRHSGIIDVDDMRQRIAAMLPE